MSELWYSTPNKNGQKPSLLSCGPMLSDIPTMTTMKLHCYHNLRGYHTFKYSQELKFSTTQSIGTPLVFLLMSSTNPFDSPSKSITNGKLGPKFECTWDDFPYTTITAHWFSTATPDYSYHISMCTMALYSQLPNTLIHHNCGRWERDLFNERDTLSVALIRQPNVQ